MSRIRLKPNERPWLRSPDAEPDENLCRRCNRLDFSELFSTPFTKYVHEKDGRVFDIPPQRIGSVHDIRRQKDCDFCDLVWNSFLLQNGGLVPPDEFDGRTIHVELESIACGLYGAIYHWVIEGSSEDGAEENQPFSIRLHFGLTPSGIWNTTASVTHRPRNPDIRATIQIINQPCDVQRTGYGRLVSPKGPNFSLLRQWISLCSSSHQDRCGVILPEPHPRNPRRLIDVGLEQLIDIKDRSRFYDYTTLSYVWGKGSFTKLTRDNYIQLHKPGAISPRNRSIPQTVRDAILVCQKLGGRYLWVDALCILQDDLDEKAVDITAMGTIYGNSWLTIVAAAGDNAESGLPGISCHRVRQHTAKVQGTLLGSLLPAASETVDGSYWNGRGWTYQERLLSKRLLIFTEYQVFFHCSQVDIEEDVISESYYARKAQLKDFEEYFSSYSLNTRSSVDFDLFAQVAAEFSRRSLSFENDVENACRGAMNTIEIECNWVIKSGLPVHLLDVGLLWYPLGQLRRRERWQLQTNALAPDYFPSWSWIGWVGPIEYEERINLAERSILQVSFNQSQVPSSSNFQLLQAQWLDKQNCKGWDRVVADDNVVSYTNRNISGPADHIKCCRPIGFDPHHSLSRHMDSGLIYLTAQVASFRITLEHVDQRIDDKKSIALYSDAPKCTLNEHFACHLIIEDTKGARVGCIIVDGNTFERLARGEYQFLKLSQTTRAFDEDDTAWDEATQSFSGEPGDPPVNQDYDEFGSNDRWFDIEKFEKNVCWALYNVLMIEWVNGIAYRLGVGKIHIHPFDKAASEPKQIALG